MTRRQAKDYRVIVRGVELLRAELLVSALPATLITEFGLTPEKAAELAGRTVEIHKMPGRRGKLDTKPFDEPG